MEECPPDPQLVSPRISFSYDLAAEAAADTPAAQPSRYDDASRRRRWRGAPAEPEFDFANAAAADVAPADRLFAGGKLLPMPPLLLPPTTTPSHARARPSPCGATGGCGKPAKLAAPAWQQQQQRSSRQPRSWTSPFSRSSSVNSAATTTTAAPPGSRFTCPFTRSRSANSAARDGSGSGAGVFLTAAGQRPHCKKVSGGAAPAGNGGGGARPPPVYYYGYGGGRVHGGISSSHGGVRVSPVLNVTSSIGTSVVNLLSYLLCDCGEKTTKSRGFRVNC